MLIIFLATTVQIQSVVMAIQAVDLLQKTEEGNFNFRNIKRNDFPFMTVEPKTNHIKVQF